MILTKTAFWWIFFVQLNYSLFGGYPYYMDCYDKAENITDTATCYICILDECLKKEPYLSSIDDLIIWNMTKTDKGDFP